MKSFLVCSDYGTGGLWFYAAAEDPAQWAKDHPELTVFYPDKPIWWTEEYEKMAQATPIDEEPFKSLIDGQDSN